MKNQKWYFNKGLKPQGPVSYEDLRLLIYKGDVGPQDLVMIESEDNWIPAGNCKAFEFNLFPASQLPEESGEGKKEWVLLVQTEGKLQVAKSGPFLATEIKGLLEQGFCSSQSTYAWKPGLSGWVRVSDRPEFQ